MTKEELLENWRKAKDNLVRKPPVKHSKMVEITLRPGSWKDYDKKKDDGDDTNL